MIQVIAVDPHPIIQTGIQFLVSQHPDMRYVGGFASIGDSVDSINLLRPNVAVVTSPLPGNSGLAQLEKFHQVFPDVALVVLTLIEEPIYAEKCLRLGVRAIVVKRASANEILAAMETAAKGGLYCSDDLKTGLVERVKQGTPSHAANRSDSLSDAEAAVFSMIGEGKTTLQIAKALRVATKTVDT